MFFDDILVYSRNRQEHLQHLKLTLDVLRAHQLFANKSKFKFGWVEIDYLGHLSLAEGVRADGKKLVVMVEWPRTKSIKSLAGFPRSYMLLPQIC